MTSVLTFDLNSCEIFSSLDDEVQFFIKVLDKISYPLLTYYVSD